MKVTFWNPLANRRGLLLDDVTQEQAEAIVARFGDKSDPNTYLPELAIEPDDES